MKEADFSLHLTMFLTDYLPGRRNASPNTIKAYRDAFVLFLRFCRDAHNWAPEKLRLHRIDEAIVLEFLEYVERQRRCSTRTRNQRLTALHSFFRYVQTEAPECLLQCQRILAIPFHRPERKPVVYFTPDETASLLALPDPKKPLGRRDVVLLSLLYDSAARVQELIDLKPCDLRLDSPAYVQLSGKGRKERIVPLMSNTTGLLRRHLKERGLVAEHCRDRPLFTNRVGNKLTRSGVRYIVLKYVQEAGIRRPGRPVSISPHTLRHTKAMHLLMAGTPLPIIRDFLGHEDISTTGIYARANIEMKREALEKAEQLSPGLPPTMATWQRDNDLLDWLRGLCSPE
jgi:integrase/recombinase XerD